MALRHVARGACLLSLGGALAGVTGWACLARRACDVPAVRAAATSTVLDMNATATLAESGVATPRSRVPAVTAAAHQGPQSSFAGRIGVTGELALELELLEREPWAAGAFHRLDGVMKDLLFDGRLEEARLTLERFAAIATEPWPQQVLRQRHERIQRALAFARHPAPTAEATDASSPPRIR